MSTSKGFEKMSEIFSKRVVKKPTAYVWQELALRIIKELNIPANKKSSVFKACKTEPRNFIETCLNDTKELCQTGEKWKYFFKLVNKEKL